IRRHARALDAEATRRAADAETAGRRRVDDQVAPPHRRDPPHRRAAARAPVVEARRRERANVDPLALVAADDEVALAVGDEPERRVVAERRVDVDLSGKDELQGADRAVGAKADARIEADALDRELELQVRGVAHAPAPQTAQPPVGSRVVVRNVPVSSAIVVRRPRRGASMSTRITSLATSAPSASAAGASPDAGANAGRSTRHAAHGRPASVATSTVLSARAPMTTGPLVAAVPRRSTVTSRSIVSWRS